jgi:hypothetical protein
MNSNGNLTALYLQNKFELKKFTVIAGVRASYYNNTRDVKAEPRISVSYPVTSGFTIQGAFGLFNQYVIRVTNENITEGSRDFWLLTEDKFKPLTAAMFNLGISYETGVYLISAEGYYKDLAHLAEFTRRFNNFENTSDFFFEGSGSTRGLEFLLQKKSGSLSGWITYTLSGARKKFDIYNGGRSFPSNEDRRHELKNVLKYNLGNWTFANTTVYSSGRPYTAAESQYYLEMLNGEKTSYVHVGDKNAERLPDYFRVDVSASYEIKFDFFSLETGLSLFNLTNHVNIWRREYNLQTFPVIINDVQTLGFTPTLFINFRTL